MIMTKTPLRVTFVGGGTDIPSFYREHGPGAVVSAAINKYIYIIVNKKFDGKIRVSYSVTEIVDNLDELKHPAVREALRMLGISGGIEIVSISAPSFILPDSNPLPILPMQPTIRRLHGISTGSSSFSSSFVRRS